jgi:predicted secreted Zn-dependent protease
VSVSVVISSPAWVQPASAAPAVVDRWNRYMNALITHENGHRDRGIAAGDKIYNKLSAMRREGSCPVLANDANASANAILAEYNASDSQYDKDTGHGKTQGAVFP